MMLTHGFVQIQKKITQQWNKTGGISYLISPVLFLERELQNDAKYSFKRKVGEKIAISSIKCGLRMATGKSKTEAIKEMKELFKKMDIDTINSRIDEITSYYGVSPYLKQS